ncbi:MAG: hypothetical protein IPP05_02975 [Cytophagaceae bacterium]|nr:hypothetical protein [Cytophagaceae bacterium]
MTKTYEGIFENGYVVFKEAPEIPKNSKVKVIFEEKILKNLLKKGNWAL